MATVTFVYNHSRDPMNPADLAQKIATSLSLATIPNVDIDPTQIIVTGAGVTEAGRSAMQTVISAYVLDPVGAGGPSAVLASRARAALIANATFLALGSPTNAQTLAQVQLLTKECNGIIRLLLGVLDSTSGT